jgi:hypothetical protein
MLNEKLSDYDILPRANISRAKTFPEVKLVDFRKGSIAFKKPACSELMTIDSSEKILTLLEKWILICRRHVYSPCRDL